MQENNQQEKEVGKAAKGRIAEERIAGLIALHPELCCYRPVVDDDGIDILVRKKGDLDKTICIQVKSRFGDKADEDKLYTQTVAGSAVEYAKNLSMVFVFCFFNKEEADITKIYLVSGPDFLGQQDGKNKDGSRNFNWGQEQWECCKVNKKEISKKIMGRMEKLN